MADSEYKETHSNLHELGQCFLKALLDKVKKPTNVIEAVCVKTQEDRIDIRVEINNSIFLIIEDKTNTEQHSEQIKEYKKKAKKLTDSKGKLWEEKNIFAIYIKTGNQSRESLPQKTDGCDGHFLRKDILSVLEKHKNTKNEIIDEFRCYLEKWEKETQSFENVPIAEWSWCACEGYYLALEDRLRNENSPDDICWSYAANQQGGALVFYWNFRKSTKDECRFWLHIDHKVSHPKKKFIQKLFIRAGDTEDGSAISAISAEIMDSLLEKSKKHAENFYDIQVEKSSHRRPGGDTGNFANIYFNGKNSYLVTKPDGKIDLKSTLERLRLAMKLLDVMGDDK